jgi:hypothetical protein
VIKPETTVLTIELDLNATPISGHLIDEQRRDQPFTGWVGLTHALNTALDFARAYPANTNSERPGRTS